MKQTDYYSILQVPPQATSEDIKVSFRRLARQYHPDLNPNNPKTAERFKQISEAYEVLSDDLKRRRYDRDLKLQGIRSGKKYPSTPQSEPAKTSRNAKDFFSRGMKKSEEKQYKNAINEYSKAIELEPNFVDAYLKRCEMRYKLGDNQGVLDDCYRVIQIEPSVSKAYYYQGRARFSLGYVEASIDSYSEAIRQNQSYAYAYYYRGIAYHDLKNSPLALEDWQTAAELFRTEGNYNAYRLTKKKISAISKGKLNLGLTASSMVDLLNNTLMTLISYIFNPVGGLLPAFTRLSSSQATAIGVIYGVCASLCLTASSYLLIGIPHQLLPKTPDFNLWELLFLNFVPFVCLSLTSTITRMVSQSHGSFARDAFLAGTSFLPFGLSFLAIGFIPSPQNIPTLPLLTLLIFGFSYAILTLYTNCTQILRLSEAKSTFIVPLMTAISLSSHYLTKSFLS